jgi:PAS domain S-box-containing protein
MMNALIAVSPEATIKTINQASCDLLGYRAEELVDQPIGLILDKEGLFGQDFENLKSKGFISNIETTYISKDAKEIPVLFSSSIIYEPDSAEFQGVVCIAQDITGRKYAEEGLRRSEERTRLIINTALDAVITMDAAGLITDWNDQAETIFGWSHQEAIGQPMATIIIPPQYRAAHERGLKHFLATGEGPMLHKRIELTALHRDGHEFPVELSISPLQLGEYTIFSAFVRDITKRKQAEASLRDSEARYKAIANTVPGVIYQFTSRNGIWLVDYVAPQILEIFGLNASDVIEDLNNFIKNIYPDDLPSFVASVTEAVENLTPWNYEGRLINPSTGELTWWQGMSTPVATSSGEVIFNGILLDITERKRAEAALRQSEQRFRQVVSSISDHIYVTEMRGEEHINLYLSPHVEPLTGYPLDKFTADWSFWPSTVIHPDDRAAAAAQAARLAQGQNSELEYRLIRANGEVIWVRDSGRVEKDTIRQSLIVYGLVSDITERKEAEAVVALARDQALETSRLKTELLAKVSHELRTPLGAILGFAELLEAGVYGSLSDKQQQVTIRIIDSTQYLTSLVNELLDQAQLEAGRLKLNIQSFAPADLVDDTLIRMGVLARAKGLSLTSDIAADVPPALWGDSARLQQILVNLVSNAIKFTPTGAVRMRLYCPDADHWAMQVSDTGSGIPVEAQTYIFEPFRQVDGSVTRAHAGTGLGLSIVKQLTTVMGGEITLKSEIGQGSTFTVSLPLQATPEKMA